MGLRSNSKIILKKNYQITSNFFFFKFKFILKILMLKKILEQFFLYKNIYINNIYIYATPKTLTCYIELYFLLMFWKKFFFKNFFRSYTVNVFETKNPFFFFNINNEFMYPIKHKYWKKKKSIRLFNWISYYEKFFYNLKTLAKILFITKKKNKQKKIILYFLKFLKKKKIKIHNKFIKILLINFEPQYFLKKYIYFFILNQTVKIFQGNWKKQIKKKC